MQWSTAYLGTRIAIIAASPQAYSVLSEHELTSWQSGGCAILTSALVAYLGAQPFALVRRDGVIDHVVAHVADGYIDADGGYDARGIVAKHATLEGSAVQLAPLEHPPPGIVCPAHAVQRLVALLEEAGL